MVWIIWKNLREGISAKDGKYTWDGRDGRTAVSLAHGPNVQQPDGQGFGSGRPKRLQDAITDNNGPPRSRQRGQRHALTGDNATIRR